MAHTLSFVILDNMQVYSGPYHTKFDVLTSDIIKSLIRRYSDTIADDNDDPTYISRRKCTCHNFISKCGSIYAHPELVDEVCDVLKNDSYYVINRLNKYYVVAFAINYARFRIWSKDCQVDIIDWEEMDRMNINQSYDTIENGEIMDNDPLNEYQDDPIDTFVRMFLQ